MLKTIPANVVRDRTLDRETHAVNTGRTRVKESLWQQRNIALGLVAGHLLEPWECTFPKGQREAGVHTTSTSVCPTLAPPTLQPDGSF